MYSPGAPFADRFRIDAEVGRGTFGIVYKAFDFVESRDVALKILNHDANADDKLKHRLRREARLTTEMKSPHCVRVLEVAETADGRAYIVMELLEGRELHTALAAGEPFPSSRITGIARQILNAVGEAHQLGVVHRDLKPSNVYLCRTADGSDLVKLLDFGIAKVVGNTDGTGLTESARLTTHGHVLGTPVYMSPEQCRGEVPTPASDLYSIGIMLFELLTGKPPFDDPNPVQVLMKQNSEPVPPLPSEVASTPLGAAILRALEKSPEKRFRSAGDFDAALTSSSLTTPPTTVVSPAMLSAKPKAKPKPPPSVEAQSTMTGEFKALGPPPAEPAQRSLIPIIVAAAVVLLLATAAVIALWPKS